MKKACSAWPLTFTQLHKLHLDLYKINRVVLVLTEITEFNLAVSLTKISAQAILM